MPNFRLHVANKKTGEESTIEIFASGKQEAEAHAQSQGWLISDIVELQDNRVLGEENSDRQILLTLDAIAAELRQIRQSTATATQNTKGRGGSIFAVVAGLIALAIVVLIQVREVAESQRFADARWKSITEGSFLDRPGFRFKSDNATGATANAIELLQDESKAQFQMLDARLASIQASSRVLAFALVIGGILAFARAR